LFLQQVVCILTYKQGAMLFEKNYYAEGRGQTGKTDDI